MQRTKVSRIVVSLLSLQQKNFLTFWPSLVSQLVSHAPVTSAAMLPVLISQKRSRGPGASAPSQLLKSATFEAFASVRQYGLLCIAARRLGLELPPMPSELYIRFPNIELQGTQRWRIALLSVENKPNPFVPLTLLLGIYFRLNLNPDEESSSTYAPSKYKQGEEAVISELDVSDHLFELFSARSGLTASRISFQSITSECEFVTQVKPWSAVAIELDSSKFETLESYPSLAFIRLQISSIAFESGSSIGLRYGTGELTNVVLHCEGEDGQQIGRLSHATNLTLKAQKSDENPTSSLLVGGDSFLVPKAMDVEYLLLQARQKTNFPVSAILVHGPAGTGKTHLVGQISARSGYKLVRVTATDILDVRVSSPFDWILKKHLQLPTDDEFADHPTEAIVDVVLFFDDIDVLLASDEVADLESQRKVLIQFEQLIDSLRTLLPKARNSVVVVGCSNSPGSIGPSTRKLFEREISIDFPDSPSRFAFLRQQIDSLLAQKHGSAPISDDAVREVSDLCHGFSLSDLETMVRVASTTATMRSLKAITGKTAASSPDITPTANPSSSNDLPPQSPSSSHFQASSFTIDDLKAAKSSTTAETLKSDLHLVPTATTKVDRAAIGGLDNAYQSLMQSTVWMVRYSSHLARLGVSSPRGVLLFGPPGTGKTLLAKCVASEWNANFLSVSISDLVRGEVGATERQISALFKTAKAIAPTIVFIDEIQALFSSRDSSSIGAHGKNMISQLTLELDGLTQDSMVSVIGATNRPDWIDSALLRPGRFERCLYIAPPPESARAHILRNLLSKYNLDRETVNEAAIDSLAKRTTNFSGADMANLCLKAAWNVIKESFGIKDTLTPGNPRSGRTTPSKFGFGASPSVSPVPSPSFSAFKSAPRQQSVTSLDTSVLPSLATQSVPSSPLVSTPQPPSSASKHPERLRRDHLEDALSEMSPSMTREMLVIYEQFQTKYGRADLQAAASEQSTLHTSPANKKGSSRPQAFLGGRPMDRETLLGMKRLERDKKA